MKYKGENQKNRGDSQQLIQNQSSNFTVANAILKVFLLPTEIRDKVQ